MDTRITAKFKIQSIRFLTPFTYVVRMDRNDLVFRPGQNLNLGLPGNAEKRDYSIYCGEQDDYLEILVKEVKDGLVSKQLKNLKQGDQLEVDGPFGFFVINDKDIYTKRFLFIASGTGIAPFHSFIRSYKELDYILLHGIRNANEAYEKHEYPKDRYMSCVSQGEGGEFKGRVTDYLREHPVDPETLCYLCGNVNMIYDVFDILKEQGVPSENLHAEVYF